MQITIPNYKEIPGQFYPLPNGLNISTKHSKRRKDLESESLEMVCVEICPDKARNTIFAVVYNPPSMNPENFLSSFKQDVLDKLTDEASKDIIMMGDFNADVIASKPCKYTRNLMHATRLHGLSQLIKEPTRVTEHTKTAIDLVFVNNLHRIVSHGVQEFAASDHSVVFAVKKAGVCKAHAEICEMRSLRCYNKERSEVAVLCNHWISHCQKTVLCIKGCLEEV